MNRTTVHSSNLKSVGYDPSTSTLEIEFNDGRVYEYYGVPQQVHIGLMNAESKGSYYHENIKNAGYSYQKIS